MKAVGMKRNSGPEMVDINIPLECLSGGKSWPKMVVFFGHQTQTHSPPPQEKHKTKTQTKLQTQKKKLQKTKHKTGVPLGVPFKPTLKPVNSKSTRPGLLGPQCCWHSSRSRFPTSVKCGRFRSLRAFFFVVFVGFVWCFFLAC